MGKRKHLPLTPAEVRGILTILGFALKRTRGSHEQWEGETHGARRIVTVDAHYREFSVDLMARVVRQSGLTPEEFYRADPKVAKRYGG